jgi:2-dehydro-3-deoxygluconokinase
MTARVDLVTLGETMALLTPSGTGPLRYAGWLRMSVGGAESNVAIGARRLGLSTAWIGRVGADDFGEMVVQRLRGEDIITRAVIDPDRPTGLMVKVQRTAGLARVTYHRDGSAGSRLAVEDLDHDLINSARVLHATGITPALSDHARKAVHAAVNAGREHGVLISIDYNYRRALWDPAQAADEFLALTRKADIVFATEDEAAIVAGPADPDELARRIADLGPGQVLIKRGPLGAVGCIDGHIHQVAGTPVVAIDQVGAGDAFAAGYLSALLNGASPADRLRDAARVGAFAVTVPGDWEGLPTRDELQHLDSPADPVIRLPSGIRGGIAGASIIPNGPVLRLD